METITFASDRATNEFLKDLRQLLETAFTGRFSDEDWEHGLGGIHIAVQDSGVLVSHAAVVPRRIYISGHAYSCGYVENVATLPTLRGRGFASLAVREANQIIKSKYEIGALSTSGKNFYRTFSVRGAIWRLLVTNYRR